MFDMYYVGVQNIDLSIRIIIKVLEGQNINRNTGISYYIDGLRHIRSQIGIWISIFFLVVVVVFERDYIYFFYF